MTRFLPRTWRRRTAAALLAPAMAAALVAGASSATAAPPHDPPGDEPLPGYEIVNPPLDPLVVDGEETTVHQGVHEHAAYIVEVPPDWNGELVMWAHGYRGDTPYLTVDPPAYGLRQTFVEQGYAWASSSYSGNGYDAGAGVRSTKDLARHTRKLLGKRAKRTYITGVSMGGHVVGRSIEEYPRLYDGAMPMCGVLGDMELFDFFLDFNVVAGALAEHDAYPPSEDYQEVDVPIVRSALGLDGLVPGGPDTTNERGKQFRTIAINRSGGPRPGAEAAFAQWNGFLFGLPRVDDGRGLAFNPQRVATNVGRSYEPNTPFDVNASVHRVELDDLWSRYTRKLTAAPRILGKPRVPVLSLHNLGDMFVPFSMEQIYAERVADNHRSRKLVQRAIRATGHCEFTGPEVITAWNDLVDWVESRGRHRPGGDDVLNPSVVADPDYGCSFSDPTATGGSRWLFAPCP